MLVSEDAAQLAGNLPDCGQLVSPLWHALAAHIFLQVADEIVGVPVLVVSARRILSKEIAPVLFIQVMVIAPIDFIDFL